MTQEALRGSITYRCYRAPGLRTLLAGRVVSLLEELMVEDH